MSAAGWELLDFVARWVHVLAGIMWVGNSLLFNWLDRSLQPPGGAAFTHAPVGSIWLLHSGGFYHVEKTLLTGEPLPRPLHWFKWQAYTTWLSGAVLVVVVYYLSDRATLADSSASLGTAGARALGLGSVVFGWALYELLQRAVAPRLPALATATWLAAFVAITLALTHWLSGRATYLHVGAMLGSIMAGNVYFTIVPSQRSLVASVDEGRGVDPVVSARAKRVSIFNNYITFPVIALMVSNHFPALYGSRWNALLLWIVVLGGAAVRHVLNLRFTSPRWKPALAGAIAGTVAALLAVLAIPAPNEEARAAAPAGPASFADARHVIDRRCAACHSATPSDLTFGAAPAGVMFDTPAQIQARAARILERAVTTRTMPPANRTHITDAEREVLARWIEGGAGVAER